MSTIINGIPEPKFVLHKANTPDISIIVNGHTEYEGMYQPARITHELQDGTIRTGELKFRFEPTVYFEKVLGDDLIELAKIFDPRCYDTIYFYPNHADKPHYYEDVFITDEAVKLAYHYLLANKDFTIKLRGKKLVDSVPIARADFTCWGNITLAFYELTMPYSELDDKEPCRVAATTNINISSPPSAIDGITLANGDRVLLTGQTLGKENGIYIVGEGSPTDYDGVLSADTSEKIFAISDFDPSTHRAKPDWGYNTDPPLGSLYIYAQSAGSITVRSNAWEGAERNIILTIEKKITGIDYDGILSAEASEKIFTITDFNPSTHRAKPHWGVNTDPPLGSPYIYAQSAGSITVRSNAWEGAERNVILTIQKKSDGIDSDGVLSAETSEIVITVAGFDPATHRAKPCWGVNADPPLGSPYIYAQSAGSVTVRSNAWEGATRNVILTVQEKVAGWARASDANTNAKVTHDLWTNIKAGTLNKDTRWKLTTPDAIILDTTALTFSKDT